MNLALAIRNLREQAKLTQFEAGTACGMQPASWSRLETGRYDPKFGTLIRAASVLGCKASELVQDAEKLPDPEAT